MLAPSTRSRRSSWHCYASARRSAPGTSRTCSAFAGSTPFPSWSSSISAGSPPASAKGGSCARGRGRVRCGRRWKGVPHVWAGLPGTADHPRHRADSLRCEPTTGARPLARLERQGIQEGRQRGQDRGHHRRDEEARGEQDVTSRLDFLCAAALSLLTIASRLPYRARLLYNWDAVQFALALREYDVLKHQPPPPGYILYVVLGRIVNTWLDDPTAAYVALAVAFSGLTTFVVYYLARAVYDRTTALAAASLLAVSPLFWFYGSVGLTYAGEALFASTVAYFAFRTLNGSRSDAYLAAWYLGIAGGMRQSLLILLLPLWCGCVAFGVRRLRVVAVGLALLCASILTWFLPMISLTGGLGRYVAASVELADSVVKPTSIVGGPLEITLRMSRYLLESVLVALGPLAAAGFFTVWYVRRHGRSTREWFLLGWTIPSVVVCTLVHFGQAGYILTFLPALVIFLSRVLVTVLGHAGESLPNPRARVALTAAGVGPRAPVNGPV